MPGSLKSPRRALGPLPESTKSVRVRPDTPDRWPAKVPLPGWERGVSESEERVGEWRDESDSEQQQRHGQHRSQIIVTARTHIEAHRRGEEQRVDQCQLRAPTRPP